MSLPVFKVEPGRLAGLGPGAALTVTGPEARHAVTVRRLAPGERLELVDGAGTRATGELRAGDRDSMEVGVVSVTTEPARTPRLVLVQALAKGDRDLLAVETATELGVDAVVPWQADRSIVRWKKERAAKSHEKWVHTVAAAAKQSRRAAWPEVLPLSTTPELARLLGEPGTRGLVLHEEAHESLADLAGAAGTPGAPWAGAERIVLVVGPEGGVAPAELEVLAGAGALAVRLGPEVLRSSTAGPAALAVLSAALGRWASGTP
ncbi:16S rRNA (uracil(1498)-N(3))-methyltransferase [Kocuria rosea]|uniref:Ribosomal RNA small subunit methyltransferase E n=1 Tax=Kocuria rosea subsp. polaris TaxID=136273 RepID=A0A0A6VSN5_KOCRO|nr:16S rRNA (uracil(1498)-N(3))-methyltransferase [Kocuria polaris]KHD96779.1 ribosomal RNA small subunit methyltransferase E [Kocuria polaris]